jgi:hypothetical protein
MERKSDRRFFQTVSAAVKKIFVVPTDSTNGTYVPYSASHDRLGRSIERLVM